MSALRCVVLGAGLMGRLTAYALAQQGHHVQVHEARGADATGAAARVAAASVLLDRGWGKAPQTVEHTGTVKFEDMTPEQRTGRIAELMAQLGYEARH